MAIEAMGISWEWISTREIWVLLGGVVKVSGNI